MFQIKVLDTTAFFIYKKKTRYFLVHTVFENLYFLNATNN